MATRPIVRIKTSAYNGSDYLLVLQDKNRGDIYLYLSTQDWRRFNDVDFYAIYKAIDSDGCTGVPDFYLNGCIVHDFHYATHKDFNDSTISRSEADRRLREYIQMHSMFGFLSPMSWWRWLAVRLLGSKTWKKLEW